MNLIFKIKDYKIALVKFESDKSIYRKYVSGQIISFGCVIDLLSSRGVCHVDGQLGPFMETCQAVGDEC